MAPVCVSVCSALNSFERPDIESSSLVRGEGSLLLQITNVKFVGQGQQRSLEQCVSVYPVCGWVCLRLKANLVKNIT